MANLNFTDTVTLIKAVSNFKTPATYLVDTFFTNKMPVAVTSHVAVEYRSGKRILAPYIVKGSRGVAVSREVANANFYVAPMTGGRRILTVEELEMRQFGEQPVFSNLTPQERAAQVQAQDLVDLQNMILNRRNKMAADILLVGKVEISGFADDGRTIKQDEIDFGFENIITPTVLWNNASADILGDLRDAVDKIAEESGELPDIMVCGKNVEKYLLQNTEIKDMLMISERSNLTIASLNPQYIAPQTRYLGYINSLGLEVYSYLETYFDDELNQTVPFIPANSVIIAKAKKGKQIFGAVSLVEGGGLQTYAAEFVPKYLNDEINNQLSLAMYSRCILAPDEISSWVHIKTCGDSNVKVQRPVKK